VLGQAKACCFFFTIPGTRKESTCYLSEIVQKEPPFLPLNSSTQFQSFNSTPPQASI